MISIVIPSRNEPFLTKTIEDLLANAEGDIEIIITLDGWWDKIKKKDAAGKEYIIDVPIVNDPRVHYIHKGKGMGMRAGINSAAALAKGEYLMKIDAHCMVGKGFDKILANDCEDNWVVIPRRKRLDADKWCIQDVGKIDIDYEYLSFPGNPADWGGAGLHGMQWNDRSKERTGKDEFLIDENMSFQGSCWFMKRKYFDFLELMDDETYGVFANEAQEIGLKCWLSGGKIMTNKKTWYAHLHKGKTHGRGYYVQESELIKGNQAVNKWLTNEANWKKQTLPTSWIIEHFWPVPSWPEDWKKRLTRISTL